MQCGAHAGAAPPRGRGTNKIGATQQGPSRQQARKRSTPPPPKAPPQTHRGPRPVRATNPSHHCRPAADNQPTVVHQACPGTLSSAPCGCIHCMPDAGCRQAQHAGCSSCCPRIRQANAHNLRATDASSRGQSGSNRCSCRTWSHGQAGHRAHARPMQDKGPAQGAPLALAMSRLNSPQDLISTPQGSQQPLQSRLPAKSRPPKMQRAKAVMLHPKGSPAG